MIEQKKRSIAKAVSWRITGTVDTIIVSFFVTGKFTLALSIGAIEVITKMFLYYMHERAWNRIKFGRKKRDRIHNLRSVYANKSEWKITGN